MLTVGEVWGVYSTRGVPGAGCILLPMDADVAAAAALRRFLGWNRTSGGYFLTPAAGPDGHAAETLAPLLAAAAARQEFLARQRARWAVVECAAEELIPLYLRQGFALRAIRPLDSLAPCFLLQAGCLAQNVPPVWLPLADRVHIAILLARGYAALESRESELINLRYFQNLTQSQTGARLGISQVQVARMESRIMAKLRERMSG